MEYIRRYSICFCVLLLAACSSLPQYEARIDLLGSPAPATATERTIVIGTGTRYVNVIGGEVIRFQVGDRAFAWRFNGAVDVAQFDLARVAPAGLLSQPVIAYIAPNPYYTGGDGEN